jgi:cyclopropane-fatty-acyl-phospholipid synthase
MAQKTDRTTDAALVEALRRLLRVYRTPFGLSLWNEVDLPPGEGDGAARVRIADKGALVALARKPSLDSFVRLHIEGRIDWPDATLFDLEDFSRKVPLKKALRDVGVGALLRAGFDLLTTPGKIGRPRGAGDDASRKRGDAATNARNVGHHYDVSNAFYQLFLDQEMVYTCAYFTPDLHDDLAKAQRDKLDLVCRKLRLKPGQRLLDIGCGWGAMIRHAARH